MRARQLSVLLLLLSALARAEEPVTILISDASVAVAGVAYRSPAQAMGALKKLAPKAVHFVPAPGVSYEAMLATLKAYKEAGIQAHTGFVGNVREEAPQ